MSKFFPLGASMMVLTLASCGPDGIVDPDLRGWMGGLNTAPAAAAAAPRPQPDNRGIITFANAQVAVAQAGETPARVAARLGINADALARHNALPKDAVLDAGAVLVLPQRIAAAQPAPAAQPPRAQAPAPAPTNPGQHIVKTGETAWAVARRYNISVQDLASWNGLPSDMALRPGQRLIIPQAGQAAPATTPEPPAPGQGSATPLPPSASQPLPDEKTEPAATPAPAAPAPNLGATRTTTSGSGRFRMPVDGAIIRVYDKGRNDGIDIAAPTGTPVSAAGAGTVAAITRDTSGKSIVVVRHDGDLMTVYAGMGDLTVARGDTVTRGQRLGTTGTGGSLHFEVRRGFESQDPEKFLN
ncbi:LysM peptidoglycan-binding domain-containing protein [Paracoccus sp. (in: a-proteobacteria)]|uniref:LysM peptidoglycan-binding domain-containing protein n=1 Tax=Paracoccus sp. TaxID=267 RepID=UPI0026DFE3C7|nr:LysM peptidoglycan-binding domain-containing protein [Paracoccus sp. (in: a-proteobacteria)]MDO5648189.1 LysM peptidoglycan-binding domain-containing protein [Paracoccus sp. (in: a-proteobacteria)]